MKDNLIVGSYSSRKGTHLTKNFPLTQVSFEDLRPMFVGKPCPFDYQTERDEYKRYKESNLFLLFFTCGNHRPSVYEDNPFFRSTNWFLLDVDKFPNNSKEKSFELLKSNCPAFVRFIQNTGKGLHLLCYCSAYMKDESHWIDVYDRCATIVYGIIENPFDVQCRTITQGCFIWKQHEYDNFDNDMFCSTYSLDDIVPLPKHILYGTKADEWKDNGNNCRPYLDIDLDSVILQDFQKMSLTDFLYKHRENFKICFESERNYTYITTYSGEKIYAFKTNGQHYLVYTPQFYDPEIKSLKPRKLKDGQRRRKFLFCTGCSIMNISSNPTFDFLLYNIVYYFLVFVDNSQDRITKNQLLDIAKNAFHKHSMYHYEIQDDRKWIVGDDMVWDEGKSQYRSKTKGEKIREAQKLRKNVKVNEILLIHDEELSFRENLDNIQKHGLDICESYYRKILRELGLSVAKKKTERVSAYRTIDGKRVSIPKQRIDGVKYVKRKKDLSK